MRDIYLYCQLLKYYLYSLKELGSVYKNKIEYFKKMNKMPEAKEKLNEELKRYLQLLDIDKKLITYILKEFDWISLSDIERMLDIFDDNYEDRALRLDSVLNEYDEYRYYDNGFAFAQVDEDRIYKECLNYVHGFNPNNIKEFMLRHEIFDKETYDNVAKDAKILDVNAKENIDMFGCFDKGLVVPKIKDELSSLIWIHEMVHKALQSHENSIIRNTEDLPIFYELLFSKYNHFAKEKVHSTKDAKRLLAWYNKEPFEEQVNKLIRLKKRH